MASCYQNWDARQLQDLEELLYALTFDPQYTDKLQLLAVKSIRGFQDHLDNHDDHGPTSIFSPSWSTIFYHSILWLADWRPSLCTRIVCSLCELEASREGGGPLRDMSADQLNFIDALHCRTIAEEWKLSIRMAMLQEELAGDQLVRMVMTKGSSGLGESSKEVELERALDAYMVALSLILNDAHKLRHNTLKSLTDILTPTQLARLLLTVNQIRLSAEKLDRAGDHNSGDDNDNDNDDI